MKFFERIKSVTESVDAGEPTLTLSLGHNKSSIRVDSKPWSPQVEDSFIGNLVKANIRRNGSFFGEQLGYTIDASATAGSIRDSIISDFSRVYTSCSFNKEPTRTNSFKQLKVLLRMAHRNDEIFEDIFKLYEYYESVTQNVSIKNENNEVHRKNILHLIDVLGKKHGR
jgi:hypothetical protein